MSELTPLTRSAFETRRQKEYGGADYAAVFLSWDFGDPDGIYYVRPCQKCGGTGYHHGFGEHGTDPDWCTVCGGGQWEFKGPVKP